MAASHTSSSITYDRMEELKQFDSTKKGVKGLVDTGITTIPQIFIHKAENLSDLNTSTKSSFKRIPIIDFTNLASPIHRPEIIKQVKEAASTWGFFQVINHSIPLEFMESTIRALKTFHEQPSEIKAKHYIRQRNSKIGYTNNPDLFHAQAASWHDYLQVWLTPKPVNTEEIPEICREVMVECGEKLRKEGERVAELLSEGLGVEAGRLKEMALLDSRLLTGSYYPFCPQPDLTLGLARHTDPGVMTIIMTNQVEGLQVKHEEEWVSVKPAPGALIVNIGDSLQVISNGEYKSVQHRVKANSTKDPKISIVEFFLIGTQNITAPYGPLPELLSPEKPAVYRSFTLQEQYEKMYDTELQCKTLPDLLKIDGKQK